MTTQKPTIKERREELKLKAQELELYQQTLELQNQQTTALLVQLQKLQSDQRMAIVREALLANALNFLTGDTTGDPQKDFKKAMTTYLDAAKTLDTLESDKLEDLKANKLS